MPGPICKIIICAFKLWGTMNAAMDAEIRQEIHVEEAIKIIEEADAKLEALLP